MERLARLAARSTTSAPGRASSKSVGASSTQPPVRDADAQRAAAPKHAVRIGPSHESASPAATSSTNKLAAEYQAHKGENMNTEETPILRPITVDDVIELADSGEERAGQVHDPPPTPGLFGTDDPALVVTRAGEISTLLARVIREKKLATRISGKEHVLVEGWTLLGSMLGVLPYTVWTRRLEDGWEARVEARTLDGRPIAAAEAECLRAERQMGEGRRLRDQEHGPDQGDVEGAQAAARLRDAPGRLRRDTRRRGPRHRMTRRSPRTTRARSRPTASPAATRSSGSASCIAHCRSVTPIRDWKAEARQIAGFSGDMLTATIASKLIDRLQELTTA